MDAFAIVTIIGFILLLLGFIFCYYFICFMTKRGDSNATEDITWNGIYTRRRTHTRQPRVHTRRSDCLEYQQNRGWRVYPDRNRAATIALMHSAGFMAWQTLDLVDDARSRALSQPITSRELSIDQLVSSCEVVAPPTYENALRCSTSSLPIEPPPAYQATDNVNRLPNTRQTAV